MLSVWMILAAGVMAAAAPLVIPEDMPAASAEGLPRWRGFNLLEKFNRDWPDTGPFRETDFEWIAGFGFNFVRLPMDYRIWIVDDDWERIDDDALADLDQALEYGARYGIHVSMNFHRAPGHTVAQPPEPLSLWDNPEALRVCALHWRHFARRFKGTPNSLLSFNLLNEPYDIDEKDYLVVVRALAAAIREEDPDRLIIADGLAWGSRPCEALIPLRVAQAARGYHPSGLSHYLASWFAGADRWPVPQWPARIIGGGYLYGTAKPDMRSPIVLHTTGGEPASLNVTVGEVSSFARFLVTLDGVEAYSETFLPGPGDGPWKEARYLPEWKAYQNRYDREISIEIPPGIREVTLENAEGDWMTITRIELTCGEDHHDILDIIPQWDVNNETITLNLERCRIETDRVQDREWLWEEHFSPWAALRERGVGVMVGEWGAFNKTPHDVTLRWMEDSLRTFQRAKLGWALWNFRGAFGILDSGRSDVEYEAFNGHQLDRKMLELLQAH